MVLITIVMGVYKPTYNWGVPPCTNITLMVSPVCEALQCLAAPPGQSWVFDGRNSPQQSGCPTPPRRSWARYKERDPQQPLWPKMQVQRIWGCLMFRFFTSTKHQGYIYIYICHLQQIRPYQVMWPKSNVTSNPNHCIVWFRFPHR